MQNFFQKTYIISLILLSLIISIRVSLAPIGIILVGLLWILSGQFKI